MSRILDVAELDLTLEAFDWPFSRERAADIAAHWEARRAATPALWDGRVLMMHRHEFATRADGRTVLKGAFFETNFSHYLAWRDFRVVDKSVCNGFSMAALKSRDGAFLLGEMGPHTSTAGRIYFPSGTPDAKDVFGDRVDLAASVARELYEETGIAAEETMSDEGWIVVYSPPYVACMKIVRVDATAQALAARIGAFLAGEPEPELARMHIARCAADIDPRRSPEFIKDFVDYAFAL